jgi:L-ascorbate 6-phosphate lactonase
MNHDSIYVTPLGQAGFKIRFNKTVIYIDPYLSDSVAEREGDDLRRMVPVSMNPETVADASLVLLTHIHADHCDLATLLPVSQASKNCSFMCPYEVGLYLKKSGIDEARIIFAKEAWIQWDDALRLIAVPAAHTLIERDSSGALRFVGYVMEYRGRRIYHAGDTSPHERIIDSVRETGSIEYALLPVNERNYFKEQRGIIGNMSIREAFAMASAIGAKTMIPTHWDMFRPNSVYREEIELLYDKLKPNFELLINPARI